MHHDQLDSHEVIQDEPDNGYAKMNLDCELGWTTIWRTMVNLNVVMQQKVISDGQGIHHNLQTAKNN